MVWRVRRKREEKPILDMEGVGSVLEAVGKVVEGRKLKLGVAGAALVAGLLLKDPEEAFKLASSLLE